MEHTIDTAFSFNHINLEAYRFSYYRSNFCYQDSLTRPPILFLHGFMGRGSDFMPMMLSLAATYDCIAIDLPGHGCTSGLEDTHYRMEPTAQGLIQIIDRLSIKPCYLVGYSMGGRLALYLALHYPEHFCKVVLESSSPGLKTQAERDQRLHWDLSLAAYLETADLTTFLDWWYSQPLFQSLQEHPDFKTLCQRRLNNNPLELARSLRQLSMGQQPSLWSQLPDNQVPLLLLVGALDQKFKAINTEWASLSQKIYLKVVPQCGHNIHFEQPDLFAMEVSQFLKAP